MGVFNQHKASVETLNGIEENVKFKLPAEVLGKVLKQA